MTLWFGPFIDLEPAHGYFHLCPSCYTECVAPHIEEIQDTLARLNPAAAAYLERERAADAGKVESEEDGVSGSDPGADSDPDADARSNSKSISKSRGEEEGG